MRRFNINVCLSDTFSYRVLVIYYHTVIKLYFYISQKYQSQNCYNSIRLATFHPNFRSVAMGTRFFFWGPRPHWRIWIVYRIYSIFALPTSAHIIPHFTCIKSRARRSINAVSLVHDEGILAFPSSAHFIPHLTCSKIRAARSIRALSLVHNGECTCLPLQCAHHTPFFLQQGQN